MLDMTFDDAINIAKGPYGNNLLTIFLIEQHERVAELERENESLTKQNDIFLEILNKAATDGSPSVIATSKIKMIYSDNAAMRALLKKCEWTEHPVTFDDSVSICNICGNQQYEGHAPGCEMSKFADGR